MSLYRNKYRVESNRLRFWNYSSPASYFITVCVENREHLLGHIENGKMILSCSGKIVAGYFRQIPTYHKRVILDEWVIMPNHFHCIITLGDYDFDNGVSDVGTTDNVDKIHADKIHEFYLHEFYLHEYQHPTENDIKQYRKLRRQMLIPKIIGKFKMQTSKQINILNDKSGTRTWQHDYYDHIIRNDAQHQRIKTYIKNNPQNWVDDKFFV